MRVVEPDFAPTRPIAAVVLAAAAVIFAVAAVALGWQARIAHARLRREVQLVSEAQARLENLRRAAAASTQSPVASSQDGSAAAGTRLFVMKAFDVDALFRTLQSSQVQDVRVTAVEWSAADRSARLDIVASTAAAVLDYVNQLDAGDPARRWTLRTIRKEADGGLTATIMFDGH